MKKCISAACLLTFLVASGCGTSTQSTQQESQDSTEIAENMPPTTNGAPAQNTLTDAEKADGWKLLFNGKTSEGWRSFRKETFPSDWKVTDDGTLYFAASQRAEGSTEGGDIIYGEMFGDFHLKLEWKISEVGNSGIFYLGQETHDYIWMTAPEMQVLDNEKHPDANMGTNGNRQAGSLYDLYAATPQNARPVGEWNQVEIICKDRKVQHIQNGEVVVSYELDTEKWKADVAASKFPGLNENWVNVPTEGYIGLQDHGDDVWFRNIKIKSL